MAGKKIRNDRGSPRREVVGGPNFIRRIPCSQMGVSDNRGP